MAQPSQTPRPQLSEQIIEQMVKQKGQEIDLRFRELAIQEKNIDQQAKYADKVLAAQAEDLKDRRQHDSQRGRWVLVVGLLALLATLVFLGLCILKGFGAIAVEIVKAVIYVGVGGLGGYAAKARNAKQSAKQEEDE